MKIMKAFKLGHRVVLSLDKDLPDDFKNYSTVKIDNHIFTDTVIPMSTGATVYRKDISITCRENIDFEGQELVIL